MKVTFYRFHQIVALFNFLKNFHLLICEREEGRDRQTDRNSDLFLYVPSPGNELATSAHWEATELSGQGSTVKEKNHRAQMVPLVLKTHDTKPRV